MGRPFGQSKCGYRSVSLKVFVLFVAVFVHKAADASMMVTVAPLRAICLELVKDAKDCTLLLAPGISPHTYEARPRDLKAARVAQALFYVSPLLDAWAIKLPIEKRFEVSSWLPQEIQKPISDGDDPKHPRFGIDPHFWLDPLAVRSILPSFANALCELTEKNCSSYKQNAKDFAARLDLLHHEFVQTLAPLKGIAFVVYHPFLGYFAKRYGLKQVAAIEPSPGKEPTPRMLKETIELVKEHKARLLVLSPEVPAKSARPLVEGANLKLVVLDDLGGSRGRESYVDFMRYNVQTLREAYK